MSKPKKTFPIVECAKHGQHPCNCANRSNPEQKKRDRRRSYVQRARARAERGSTSYTEAYTPHPTVTASPAAAPPPPSAPPTPASPPPPPPSPRTWVYEWVLNGEDIAHDILMAVYDRLVEAVHADGMYPAGYTEFEGLLFSNVDHQNGTADFSVDFSAEHWSEDGLNFPGTVDGSIRFAIPEEDEEYDDGISPKKRFLENLALVDAEATFKMD